MREGPCLPGQALSVGTEHTGFVQVCHPVHSRTGFGEPFWARQEWGMET